MICLMLSVFRHNILQFFSKFLRIHEWLFSLFFIAPDFYRIPHTYKTYALTDSGKAEHTFGNEKAPVAVKVYRLGIRDECTINLLLPGIPSVQLIAQIVKL